jgi:transmembrane 9 superfamily member 2/4
MKHLSIALLVLVLMGTVLCALDQPVLPGMRAGFREHDRSLLLKVNKLTSLKNLIPYDHYSLPFCAPEAIKSEWENIGELVQGERIENSLYSVRVISSKMCAFCAG